MAPLAVLPMFFKLDRKKAVVAGGSDAAARKAELLAATGAEVHVYAEELEPAFSALLAAGSAAGTFVHHRHDWDDDIFSGAVIAIADIETGEEAVTFFDAACVAGVPVNVIDKPAYCGFQFGSIFNRSPAVVAVSTDGAAPILDQAIRRRIEAKLIANGLSRATPVALASAVSRPNERHWAGQLDGLCRAMDEIGIDEPVLIGVGQVFAAQEQAFRSNRKAA